MAASKIIPKKSVVSKIPLPTDLESGEICINHADRKLYAKHPSTGAIQEIGAYEHSHDELYSLDGTQHLEFQNNGSLVLTGATTKTFTLPSASGTLVVGSASDLNPVNTIRAITSTEYDALGSFDPNTIYFII